MDEPGTTRPDHRPPVLGKGKSCPIVATFGQDPLTFMASNAKIPWGRSELDFVGGLRGRPLDIVKGPITGLPIPAYAEIAIEGEIPPPSEQSRNEGPTGDQGERGLSSQ